jgi:hypothetical protein
MRGTTRLATLLTLLTSTAVAQNMIYERNGWDPINDFQIDQNLKTVLIKRPVAGTFRFYARELSTGDPGIINSITVDPGWQGAGTIGVMVWAPTNDEPGAETLGEINLSVWYHTSTLIKGIWITGDLGTIGYSLADDFSTRIHVEGDLRDHLAALNACTAEVVIDGDVYGALSVGGMTQDVTIGGDLLAGSISAQTMTGDITINGTGPHAGGIGILEPSYTYAGSIAINGPMTGYLNFADNLSGTVTINGDITSAGKIELLGVLSGIIHIDGDVVDGTGNWVRIRQMSGGHFECNDLELKLADGGDWFVLGAGTFDPNLVHSGTIDVNGTPGLS